MTKQTLILIINFSIFTLNLFPQVQQEWVRRYNGPGNLDDYAVGLEVDVYGNVFVTGYSIGIGSGDDFATIKYNSAGVQLWLSRYTSSGNRNDRPNAIATDSHGNVYVTGSSTGSESVSYYVTIKYDSSGNQQWVAAYDSQSGSANVARSVCVDLLGNVYITGISYGIGTSSDYATLKYNSNGVQQWLARYNGPPGNSPDNAYDVDIDNSGNVYVTGSSTGIGTNLDIATIKYSNAGIQQWVIRYGGTGVDVAYSLEVDAQNSVYVTGFSDGTNNYDYATIKYDSSGLEQWVKRYNGSANYVDVSHSLVSDNQGYVYVTGYSIGIGTYEDYATIKYSSSGSQQWVSRYHNLIDYSYGITVDVQGNIYVTGSSSQLSTNDDYATLKYNSNGVQQWLARYNGPGNNRDIARSIKLDSIGNVYVTGYSRGTTFDYATIKYSQLTGLQSISSEIPEQYGLSQNYPNPFNPVTKIKFDVPTPLNPPFSQRGEERSGGGFVTLTVYDILGREVTTLVNESATGGLQPGTYEVEFDGGNYPSGVYYYKLSVIGGTLDYVETKKMILLK